MTTAPGYVQRLGRAFEAMQVLDCFPKGMYIDDLAAMLDCQPSALRADLKAMNTASEEAPSSDVAWVEFLADLVDPDDVADSDLDRLMVDAEDAVAVRLHGAFRRPAGGLSIAEVGQILLAAQDLARTEPDNEALQRVVAELRSRFLPGVTEPYRPSQDRRYEAALSGAVEDQRRVRITYERVWQPGIVERIIEPYALVRTHRGFEVDAGPATTVADLRTYLVHQIRHLEVLDEGFDRPADIDTLRAEHRRATKVTIVAPAERAFAVEELAESVRVLARDEDLQLEAELIEPLAARVGLLILQTGPGSYVVEPGELDEAGVRLARELLMHHGL